MFKQLQGWSNGSLQWFSST